MKLNYPSILRFQQRVELKDYQPPTKKAYVRYLCRLADHSQRDPAALAEDDLRGYFVHLRDHRRYSRSPMHVAKCALRLFFRDCVGVTGWTVAGPGRVPNFEGRGAQGQ